MLESATNQKFYERSFPFHRNIVGKKLIKDENSKSATSVPHTTFNKCKKRVLTGSDIKNSFDAHKMHY